MLIDVDNSFTVGNSNKLI